MIKRISLLVTAALLAATMAMGTVAPSAFAASAAERACTGDWVDTQGGGYCDTSTESSGPTTGTGNDPQTTEDTNTTTRHGRGVGEGAITGTVQQHCEYSQQGNLFESKSDAGCPDPEPTA